MATRLLCLAIRRLLTGPLFKAQPTKSFFPQKVIYKSGHFIPPDQYDHAWVPKMKFPQVLNTNWELLPLFGVTSVAMTGMFYSIFWAIRHKVDVVFSTHNRKNLSRTMNLLNPPCHKIITINQVYEPWPKMYTVLEKMKQEQCKRIAKQKAKDEKP